MMIDKLNTFGWEQALTATALATDQIDLLPTGGALGAGSAGGPDANTTRDIGAGEPLYLFIHVAETLDSAGETATLTATLESDVVSTLNSANVVHWTSGSIAEASLNGGYWVAKGVAIPPGDYKRYLGVRYTVGTENFTSGKISAWLGKDRFDTKTYVGASKSGVN